MPSPFGKCESVPLYGIVLKTAAFGESNAMYAILDKNLGRLDAGAYGVKNEKSRKRHALMAGNIISGEMDSFPQANRYTIREVSAVTECRVHNTGITSAASLYIILEVLEMTAPRGTPVAYFNEIEEFMTVLTDPEPLKYTFCMLVRIFSSEGHLPDIPEKGQRVDFFGRPFSLGNGSARFMIDCLRRCGFIWLKDIKLSDSVTANLSSFFSLLAVHTCGRGIRSFSLLPCVQKKAPDCSGV